MKIKVRRLKEGWALQYGHYVFLKGKKKRAIHSLVKVLVSKENEREVGQ